MNINHISVSRHDCFKECPAKYKYRYHLKIPTTDEPFYFTYGKIVHTIAENLVISKGKKHINECAKEILEGKVPFENYQGEKQFAPPLPTAYKKRLPGHLKSIDYLCKRMGYGGTTEYKFEYNLDPPHRRLLVGFIDRVVEKDGKYWIIDYKTTKKGKWRKTPQTIVADLQLRCYARVVQKCFEVPAKNIQAALYYVEGGNLVGARFSQESLLGAEAQLLKTYKQIEQMSPEDAWGCCIDDRCKWCDYKKVCSCRKLT